MQADNGEIVNDGLCILWTSFIENNASKIGFCTEVLVSVQYCISGKAFWHLQEPEFKFPHIEIIPTIHSTHAPISQGWAFHHGHKCICHGIMTQRKRNSASVFWVVFQVALTITGDWHLLSWSSIAYACSIPETSTLISHLTQPCREASIWRWPGCFQICPFKDGLVDASGEICNFRSRLICQKVGTAAR